MFHLFDHLGFILGFCPFILLPGMKFWMVEALATTVGLEGQLCHGLEGGWILRSLQRKIIIVGTGEINVLLMPLI